MANAENLRNDEIWAFKPIPKPEEIAPPLAEPFYDPSLSYENNFFMGPSGEFSETRNRNYLAYEFVQDATHEVMGVPLDARIGISAGPLLNADYAIAALNAGWSVVTYKTVRSLEWKSQAMPNMLALDTDSESFSMEKAAAGIKTSTDFTEPLCATNSFGVPSTDPEFWQQDLRKVLEHAREGQLVIASVQGTKKEGATVEEYVKDWQTVGQQAVEAGAKVIELNLSCPNQGKEGILCNDTETCARVAESVREAVGEDVKILLKLSYLPPKQLIEFIERTHEKVNGYSTMNAFQSRTLMEDGNAPAFGVDRPMTGACGAELKPMALEMVQVAALTRKKLEGDFIINGIGGVESPEDYTDFRLAGADLVGCATGAIFKPNLARVQRIFYPDAAMEETVLAELGRNVS